MRKKTKIKRSMRLKQSKESKQQHLDAQLTTGHDKTVESTPVIHSTLPEEQELHRFYKTLATTVWRLHNVVIDTAGTNEPRESLDERAVSRIARYRETLEGALEDVNVQIKGDYEGHPCDEGDAVKVISSEDRKDLARDEYIETLLPTVRLVSKDGALLKLLQQAEVVVGKASGSK